MRNIINISMPAETVKFIKQEVKKANMPVLANFSALFYVIMKKKNF